MRDCGRLGFIAMLSHFALGLGLGNTRANKSGKEGNAREHKCGRKQHGSRKGTSSSHISHKGEMQRIKSGTKQCKGVNLLWSVERIHRAEPFALCIGKSSKYYFNKSKIYCIVKDDKENSSTPSPSLFTWLVSYPLTIH